MDPWSTLAARSSVPIDGRIPIEKVPCWAACWVAIVAKSCVAACSLPADVPAESGGAGAGSSLSDANDGSDAAADDSAGQQGADADTDAAALLMEAQEAAALANTAFDAAGDADDSASPARYAGTWSGTTSQNQTIRFVVDGYGVDEWEYGWVLPACTSTTRTTFAAPVPIVGDRVDHTVPAAAGGVTTAMVIVFDTDSACHGTIHFTLKAIPNVPSCSGDAMATFTAIKQ